MLPLQSRNNKKIMFMDVQQIETAVGVIDAMSAYYLHSDLEDMEKKKHISVLNEERRIIYGLLGSEQERLEVLKKVQRDYSPFLLKYNGKRVG